jgi:hypothetical protein
MRSYSGMEAVSSSAVRDVESNVGNEEDDEEDEFADLLDDFVTPYEQERAQGMRERMEMHQRALSIGLGKHSEDSMGHILEHIAQQPFIVIHVYDSSSAVCARLDLELEKLATIYLGTMFRRIGISAEVVRSLRSVRNFGCVIPDSRSPMIIAFRNGMPLCVFEDLSMFGDADDVYSSVIVSNFDSAGVLATSLSEAHFQGKFVATTRDDEVLTCRCIICGKLLLVQDSEVPEDSFCEDPTCSRRFPHEHISPGAAPSFLLTAGRDVFAEKEMSRV